MASSSPVTPSSSNVVTSGTNSLNSAYESAVNQTATNSTYGQQDYTARTSAVASQDSNYKFKVALVGRYGSGTQNSYSGNTTATTTSTTYSSIVFDVRPELSESGQTLLQEVSDIRTAGSIIIYAGSPSRTFNINAKLVSPNSTLATANLKRLNILKAWRMPVNNYDEPETIRLYAYGNNINGIPCMLSSLNISYPDDVDYIYGSASGSSTMDSAVPIVMNINITLKEVRNFDDISAFNYESYKAGTLEGW